MPAGLQDVRKRIKSIKNTRQVTRAMEAVAASKMRKSVEKALASRNYALLAAEMLQNISRQGIAKQHPLIKSGSGDRILLLLITSNRGLCGGFNAQIIKETLEYAKSIGENRVDFVSVGKKGEITLKRFNASFLASFENKEQPSSRDAIALAQFLSSEFLKGKYEKVAIAFTDFRSALKQVPTIKTILPFSLEITEIIGPEKNGRITPSWTKEDGESEYLFEPNAEQLLDIIIPRLLETQVYQVMLESQASEHSARMFAMRNATENASEMIDELTLTYNQARQAGITQEIAEISAGKAALTS